MVVSCCWGPLSPKRPGIFRTGANCVDTEPSSPHLATRSALRWRPRRTVSSARPNSSIAWLTCRHLIVTFCSGVINFRFDIRLCNLPLSCASVNQFRYVITLCQIKITWYRWDSVPKRRSVLDLTHWKPPGMFSITLVFRPPSQGLDCI